MPFCHCAFISYRHSEFAQNRKRTEELVDALAAELEMHVGTGVYIDRERLKGGQFYQETLAAAVCRSVCMVVLYWPTYFSRESTFCSREYRLMEKLEAERLAQLTDAAERRNGLIIVIALRNFDAIPREIRGRRQCYNFEKYALCGNINCTPEFYQDVKEIAVYIAGRCRVFGMLPPPDLYAECDRCSLPSDEDVRPWLEGLLLPPASCVTPYPTREAGR